MSIPTPTTWKIHLAAHQPKRAVTALLFVVLALFAVNTLMPPAWGPGGRLLILALSALLLIGSIAEFLFPVTYTLDAEGAHSRHFGSHRLLPWSRVRRVYLRRDGIKLSPLAVESWAENYRGVYLRTEERDAVLDAVRAWLHEAHVEPEIVEES